MKYVGTIVARNYLAQAMVLAESIARTNPDVGMRILVLDSISNETHGDLFCLPSDLPLDESRWNAMAASYSVMELATAVKAKFLEYLLDLEGDSAIYLDPDIKVFSSLDPVFDALTKSEIVLTPHCLSPIPRDSFETSEETIRHAGIFNLGFVGVSQLARPFLEWWHERLLCDAVVDLQHALFTDQRWVDFAPSLFKVQVLRHFGANVAYWNLQERKLGQDSAGNTWVNGQPLLFFHFSGFDPGQPWILTKHTNSRQRFDFVGDATLLKLTQEYAEDLRQHDHEKRKQTPYGLERTPSGIELTPEIRRLYREAWRRSLVDNTSPPPDPFAEPVEPFIGWLRDRRHGIPGFRFTDLDLQLWSSRPDLKQAFPDPMVSDAEAYVTWLRCETANSSLNEVLARQTNEEVRTSPLRRGGFSVLGYFNAELGVGEAGRRLVELAELSGRPTELVAVSTSASREQFRHHRKLVREPSFEQLLLAVNADQTDRVSKLAGLNRFPSAHRIGFWFWELSHFPDIFQDAFKLVDEVWCASDFIKDAVSAATNLPVRRICLPIRTPLTIPGATKEQVGLPRGFNFLFVFDFHSVVNRKNPFGAIDAFQRAFSVGEGANLVIKTINGDSHTSELSRLKWECRDRPDIHVLDGYVSSLRLATQIQLSECFISLHRSEGYGLNLASALALDRPVIATSYSGNLDFMPPEYPFLVDYTLTPVGPNSAPYPEDATWAEPCIEHASTLMRWVFDHRDEAHQIAARFGSLIRCRHSIENSLDQFNKLIS